MLIHRVEGKEGISGLLSYSGCLLIVLAFDSKPMLVIGMESNLPAIARRHSTEPPKPGARWRLSWRLGGENNAIGLDGPREIIGSQSSPELHLQLVRS